MSRAHDIAPQGDVVLPNRAQPGPSAQWHAVETLPRRESIAIQNLTQQRFSTFWPRFWKTQSHARQKKTVLASLFPNYIFVQINPVYGPWRSINGTLGVKRLVASVGARPIPIAAVAMEFIFARCERGIMTRLLDHYEVGQLAKVISGPLAEQLVSIERLDDGGRVQVLMNLLGTKVLATLPLDSLGPR